MLVAPGEELIAETNSHIVRAELGAAAVFSGITTRTWPAKNGLHLVAVFVVAHYAPLSSCSQSNTKVNKKRYLLFLFTFNLPLFVFMDSEMLLRKSYCVNLDDSLGINSLLLS